MQVVGIDERPLGRRVEEIGRVANDELIERRAAGHHHRGGSAGPPPRASRALPRGGDRARISRHDADIERADVDAEFQRVGGDDGPHRTVAQPLLDLAATVRQIPAAIAADALLRPGLPLEIVLQVRRQNLGGETALGKDDELEVALEEFGGDAPGLAEIRAPDTQLMVDDGRVDEDEELLAARRTALVDQLERPFGQALGQLPRIRNRRRRTDEDRIRSVVPAYPAQPPQHVAQMAAEHAAIGVQLVDDHITKILEQLRPAGMVRQDSRVQHVRIAEDKVSAAANGAPRVLRRVAIVGEHANLLARIVLSRAGWTARERLAHGLQLGELILRERLGRKQVEGPARRILQDRVQHRHVVAERLARRGRCDDHDVAARERVLDGLGLVRVELADATRGEGVPKASVELLGERRIPRRTRGQTPECRHVQIGRIPPTGERARSQALKGLLQRAVSSGSRHQTSRLDEGSLDHGPRSYQPLRRRSRGESGRGMVDG